ncbi:MAG TPA: hypothetical protein VIW73_03155 [Candidatus Cybelea sp.]
MLRLLGGGLTGDARDRQLLGTGIAGQVRSRYLRLAAAAARPAGVGLKKPPPPQAKTYVTSDGFATVRAWYRAHLKGATELQQPGMEKTEDAFLVGGGASGTVVMIQSYQGKTWIVIGPPM